MRTATVSTDVYKFDELSKKAKAKAIQNNYYINVDEDSGWEDCVIEDAKQCAEIMGIEISNIYFSGFSYQGDGACFEGYYRYKSGCMKTIKRHAPLDEELHRIAKELYLLQIPHNYKLEVKVKHDGSYNHDMCTDFEFFKDGDYCYGDDFDEAPLKDTLRDFMKWIYKKLKSQHEYETDNETIKDTIEANDYEFTKDGEKY